jgi:hypothetical protein
MKQQIETRMPEIENYSTDVTTILSDVVSQYTKNLDEIMCGIERDILQVTNPAIYTIEQYFLNLSSCLYFMCEQVEKLGVYDSISKSKAQETYNNSYLQYQFDNTDKKKKPTVAELTAMAENDSLYDKTVNDIYNKAYKIVKNKVSAAETMISTLSKILSHRVQESQMTMTQTGRRILNEEVVF